MAEIDYDAATLARKLQNAAYRHGQIDSEDRWSDKKYRDVANESNAARLAIIEHAQTLAERAKKLEETLRKIANPANYGEDGCWDADSYPPEIALAALEKKP